MRRLLPQSAYARNVLTLMTGTTLAQAIPIAISPLLTRMYSPKDFGLAALYLSCLSVLSLIATVRYELAITLPANDEDAANVVTFTLKLSALISALLYVPIFLFGTKIAYWLGNTALAPWLYLLPVSVLVTALFNVFQYWCNRKSEYQMMSLNRVQNAATGSIANVMLGFLKISGGMILGPALGQALATGLIGRRVWAKDYSLLCATSWQKEKEMAKRYIDFPKHIAPAQLLGAVAVHIPVFMIGNLYSLAVLGFFYMAYRMVSLPSSLIANSIGDVYRQKISQAYSERGEFLSIFVGTLKKTIFLASPPFVVIYFIAPGLFELVFGVNWRVAGEYAQILVVGAFFQFIFTPIDKGAVVVGATRYIFVWHTARFLAFIFMFYVVKHFSVKIDWGLWLFVFINSMLYFVEGVKGYSVAKNGR